MRRLLVIVTTLLMAASRLPAGQPAPSRPAAGLPAAAPESLGLQPAGLADATALLRQFVADGKIAGAVAAVARKGSVGYLEPVGVQDLQTRAPMTPRTLFRIYSMAKPVTAVAVMMLHDEGRFRLDDPVARYLPEFDDVQVVDAPGAPPRRPVRPITVEDLLLHTSGLSHRTSDLYRTLGVRDRTDPLPVFVRKITRAPLMEDPHTRFRYSEATTVLGRLVEIWSGQPFDVFLRARVFTPLGMPDTSFWVEPARRDRLATVYGPAPAGGLAPVEIEALPFTERPALLEGAVGLVSTVPDYLRFSQMLLDRGALGGVRVLKAETVERMVANGLPAAVQAARGGAMGWGLANVNVLLDPGSSGASRGEYGWDGTAGTIFWVDPVKQTVIVLMTQSAPANPDGLRQKFKAIVQRAIS
ncbi:MAG: serine hydrolase domain-containing protein [Vicinamibacterales bacterium]